MTLDELIKQAKRSEGYLVLVAYRSSKTKISFHRQTLKWMRADYPGAMREFFNLCKQDMPGTSFADVNQERLRESSTNATKSNPLRVLKQERKNDR